MLVRGKERGRKRVERQTVTIHILFICHAGFGIRVLITKTYNHTVLEMLLFFNLDFTGCRVF